MKKLLLGLLGPLYLIILIGLPFWTFSGWGLGFFIMFALPIFTIVTIFILVKFYKNIEKSYKWLLYLLAVYIVFLMCINDGGDGDTWQGIEVFISHVAGRGADWQNYILFIPEPLARALSALSSVFLVWFILLNIAFLKKDFKAQSVSGSNTIH